MRRWLPVLLIALLPVQARADLTATYVAPDTHKKTIIQVAANGDFRMDGGQAQQDIIGRGDEAYLIEPRPHGPVVMRATDLFKIVAELVGAPKAKGVTVSVSALPAVTRKGSVTIKGRVGDAYYAIGPDGRLSARPFLVISHDPALALLGSAVARLLALSKETASGTAGADKVAAIAALLKDGAPILSPDGELESVSFAPIAAARFNLPASPLPLDEVRRALTEPTP